QPFRYHCELHQAKLCNEADHQREKEQKEEGQGGLQQEQDRKVKPHAMRIHMTQNESGRLRGNGEQRQATQVDPRWHEHSAKEQSRRIVSKEIQGIGWLI